MNTYEDTGKMSKEAMDNAMKSFSVMTKGMQQIAAETTDFTKRSYEHSAKTFEQLAQVKSLDKVVEVQNEYAKSAYQAWVAQATKMGELYADLAKEAYKPFETMMSSAANAGLQTVRKAA
ncbi:MAG: phasin family protein [Rhizobiaceae bacterium]|nr:phasin family protein [Rhizobiaceae bacterium]